MGALYAFDLQPFIDKYSLRNYVETGTGIGDGFAHAYKYSFVHMHTIDIDEDLINQAADRIEKIPVWESGAGFYRNVKFHCGRSSDKMREIIPHLPEEPTLFFLDAHFPGADFHKLSYEESLRTHMWDAFPLKDELTIIKEMRDGSHDVIIIDDFILYEDGDYDTIREGVTWNYGWLQEELGLQTNSQFIYDLFGETHNFTKDTRHQGYLIITPKD